MDALDLDLLDHFSQTVPIHNVAFLVAMDAFLLNHGWDVKGTKFEDLPRWAQSEILQKAAVDLRGPIN